MISFSGEGSALIRRLWDRIPSLRDSLIDQSNVLQMKDTFPVGGIFPVYVSASPGPSRSVPAAVPAAVPGPPPVPEPAQCSVTALPEAGPGTRRL